MAYRLATDFVPSFIDRLVRKRRQDELWYGTHSVEVKHEGHVFFFERALNKTCVYEISRCKNCGLRAVLFHGDMGWTPAIRALVGVLREVAANPPGHVEGRCFSEGLKNCADRLEAILNG